MIDWLTFRAPLTQLTELNGGRVISTRIDPETHDESVEWCSTKRLQIFGSHDASIQLRSWPRDPKHYVDVSGNPVKFFQGHNVFGTDDLHGLVIATYLHIIEKFKLEPTKRDLERVMAGDVELSRVDVTYSWDLGTRVRVRTALQALEQTARMTHRGRGSLFGTNTLYYGQHSRRWGLKLYGKAQELLAHKLHVELRSTQIPQHAEGLLRAEARFQGLELKRLDLAMVRDWKPSTPSELHRAIMDRLEISESTMLDPQVIKGLPGRLIGAYELWQQGHDLRAIYPNATFYRYRKQLLEKGIDIAQRQASGDTGPQVVPLRVVLNAQPVGTPGWALDTSLYFEPRRTA